MNLYVYIFYYNHLSLYCPELSPPINLLRPPTDKSTIRLGTDLLIGSLLTY